MKRRKYGWIPDVPDHRDMTFKRSFRFYLPRRVDLRDFCSPVEDQGELGSCTAQALAGNMEFLDRKLDGRHTDMSRLFIYYNERVMEGTIQQDAGAYIRNGIKTLAKEGCCAERLWPYCEAFFADKPPESCYKKARDNRITRYERLGGVQDTLSCLADGYPVVFGIAVYPSFETESVAQTGRVEMPRFWERMLGGHAVMAVGYDMGAKRFIVRNSWGTEWGDKGYFTLPFKYVERLGDDFWTIRK